MKNIIAIALLLTVAGCASDMPRTSRYAELTYQTLHAADYSQTMRVAKNPSCYYEGDGIARAVIGRHPSQTEVSAYFAVTGLIHYGVSRWLDNKVRDSDDDGWRWIRNGWQVFSILDTARTVRANDKNGLTPFGSDISSRCP